MTKETNDPYVPQVGHLVDHDGLALIVMRANPEQKYTLLLNHKGGTIEVRTRGLTFIADRSAEWEALFQLDTPTP